MSDIKLIKHGVPVRFGKASDAPASPENGMIYYDTTSNLFKVYENSTWQVLSTRDYADSRVAGFDIKESCEAATVENLSATYANGTSGVGATLTGAGALGTIDGVTLSVGKRLLVQAQTAQAQNGVYTVTALNPFVLTRAVDFDSATEVNGGERIFVKNGTVYGNCTFICSNSGAPTFGTTAITFNQFSGTPRSLQQFYSVGGEISTSASRDVIVSGSEKLEVTAVGGMEITNALSAGATLLSSASVSGAMSAASGKLAISSAGNITKLNNVTTSFPTSASIANYALANDGSGNLTFNNLAISNLNDVTLTSLSNGQFLNYSSSSSKWVNISPLSAADMGIPTTQTTIVSSTNKFVDSPGAGVEHTPGTRIFRDATWGAGMSAYGGWFQINPYPAKLKKVTVMLKNDGSTSASEYRVRIYSGNSPSNVDSHIAESEAINGDQITGNVTLVAYDFIFTNAVSLTDNGIYTFMVVNSAGPNNATGPEMGYWMAYTGDTANNARGLRFWGGSLQSYGGGSYGPRYKLTWATEVAATSPTMGVLATNTSGYLASSFLQYNVNLGNNILSGISSPSVSTDLANKAYVDAVTLQTLYNQDADGSGATITTGSVDGDLIIAGSEKLLVSATSGLDISQILGVSGSMTAGSLIAGSGSMNVSALGDLSKIKGVSYSFPSAQAAAANYILVNNGSGGLSWSNLQISEMNDVAISSVSNDQILRFDGSDFANESAVTYGGVNAILMSDASGRLASEALQYNVNFGNNILSNIAAPVGSLDAVPKAVVDAQAIDPSAGTASLKLQQLYNQDTNGSDVLITTNSSDGSLEIAGTESLKVSGAKGFLLADNSDDTKFTKLLYKDGLVLSASQTATALAALTFSSTTYQGCMIEYRMKDSTTGVSRVGMLLISTDGTNTSISDSFAETAPIGVSWSAAISGSDVEVRYTTDSTAKVMSAKIKLFA